MMNKGTIRRIVAAAACATFLLCPKLDAANTQFTAVQLSPEEIAWLKKELALKEPEYDPEARMLYCYTKEKHYHSDLEGGVKVHQTRESLEYAVALLKTGDDTLMQRGIDIVRTVLPMQEKDPAYPFCGIWPYYPEDPLRGRQAAVDYNWADFIAVPLIDVVINHADYAGDELVAEIKDALMLAARAIQRRNVQPDYTNICIMGTYVCYITGDICNQPELTAYAQKRLKHFYDYTLRNHGFTEYNSPTYTLVAMDELLRMKQTIVNPQDRRMVDELYDMCWDLIGRHFHQPTGQWCGPYLRTYSNLADPKFHRLLYNASDGLIDLPGDYLRIPNVMHPHKIPDSALPLFTRSVLPRLEVDTFVVAKTGTATTDTSGKPLREQDIIGRLYATPRLALASVNQGYMWNQTRPLIAHWGDNVQTPAYMQVRFLHDGYDFSAVNIFCAQDSTNVVALFNIATDGGDTHPNLDRLQNATFEAEDLRLRIQFGGTPVRTATLTLPQKRDGFTQFTCGDIHARLQVPYANWDKAKGHWEAGSDGATQWADFVLYSGKKKTFRLDEVREAVVALYLSFSTNPDMPKGKSTVRRQGGYLTLSYSTPGHAPLQVTAPAKPADERRIKADYATRSPQPGQ